MQARPCYERRRNTSALKSNATTARAIAMVLDAASISGTRVMGLQTIVPEVAVHTTPVEVLTLVDDTTVCANPVPPRTPERARIAITLLKYRLIATPICELF